MLVGRVDGVAVQTEAHQNSFTFQFLFKKRYNRDTSATSLWNRGFPKSFLISFLRGFVPQTVNWRNVSLSAVMWCYFYANAFRSNAFKMFFEKIGDFFPILVWHQTHTYFCKRFAGNHRFCAFANVAAPNSVYV